MNQIFTKTRKKAFLISQLSGRVLHRLKTGNVSNKDNYAFLTLKFGLALAFMAGVTFKIDAQGCIDRHLKSFYNLNTILV
jgi:hypothetical protein